MPVQTIWGSINANGTKASGENYSVTLLETGVYVISFEPVFNGLPAVVGSQTRYGNIKEHNTDGVAFPLLSYATATAVTGNGDGSKENRDFSFIATGLTK